MDYMLSNPMENAATSVPVQHRFEPYDDNGGYEKETMKLMY